MNSRPASVGGAGSLKALKDKMQLLRDEAESYRDKCEMAEKQVEAERLEREKVLVIFISAFYQCRQCLLCYYIASYIEFRLAGALYISCRRKYHLQPFTR